MGSYRSFAIDQKSGMITLKKSLDRERQKIYEVCENLLFFEGVLFLFLKRSLCFYQIFYFVAIEGSLISGVDSMLMIVLSGLRLPLYSIH